MNQASHLSTGQRVNSLAERMVAWLAVLWGVCIVLPIGLQYLCLFLLVIFLCFAGRHKPLFKLFTEQKLWASAVILFAVVTLLALATQEQYFKETPSNLWHGFRILLTLLVALSLSSHEAKRALTAALASLAAMSLLVAAHFMGWLEHAPEVLLKLVPSGNQWIAMSILLAMLTVASMRLVKTNSSRFSWLFLIATSALAMNLFVMNQRTAFLALMVGFICLALSRWRQRMNDLLLILVCVVVATIASIMSVEAVSTKFKQGFTEISQARSGLVSSDSMNIRYHMYTKTTDMLMERPWLGWGIGSWNAQWKKRIDPLLHRSNMPHNDFLWMGAQAGFPGALAWLCLMVSLCWIGWQRNTASGQIAFSIAAMSLASSLVNSGTRDASIGLPMLFVVGACLAWSRGTAQDDPKQRRMD
jgi:O-antigen ligase